MNFSPGESQAIELSGEDPPRPSGAEAGPESRDTEHSAGDVKMQELPADENAPHPWPLPDNPQETAGTTRKPLRSSAKSTQKKLFEYPRTPVSAVKPLSSTSDDESDDDHDHKWSMHRASGSRTEKSTTSKDAKKAQAPGGPSSIVNPLALVSLRKQPPPPPPSTSRHVPNIADIGASLVAEAAVMMKHRLAEHTLSTLAARMSEEIFKASFRKWHHCATNERNFIIRAQRALDRLGLRVQRRALESWQNRCMWSRIIENLAKVAIIRNEARHKQIVLSDWNDRVRRTACVNVISRRNDVRCLQSVTGKWVMSVRISRVRSIQLARLLQRKDERLVRASFDAHVAVLRAERSLYKMNRFVQKTAILSVAVTLRAWRERIECTMHLEKAGRIIARRWELIRKRQIFKAWFEAWAYNRCASHASFAIDEKARRRLASNSFTAWIDAQYNLRVMHCSSMYIARRSARRLAIASWTRWVEARTSSRHLRRCYSSIQGKYKLRVELAQGFDGWKMVLDESRRLKAVSRRKQLHDWQCSGQVLALWRNVAKRCRKFRSWHDTTARWLRRIWLHNCFDHWQVRSRDYFRSWRKSEKLKSRLLSAQIRLHYVTWKEKLRSKIAVTLFSAKINTRVLGNCLQEWFSFTQRAIAKTGRAEVGIWRMASVRAFGMLVECMDLWHAKICCRKRVDEIGVTNSQKASVALMDKYFAVLMRKVDDSVFREAQVLKNERTRRVRLLIKTISCFARNHEDKSTYRHRTRHIQTRLQSNLTYNVFEWWVDAWYTSRVKGKLYFGLIARGNFRVTAWSWQKWCSWLNIRRLQERKVSKAAWLNIPRHQASGVLKEWSEKHQRTKHFQRLVSRNNSSCCQVALDCWYDAAKDSILQTSSLTKLRQRVDIKTTRYYLETWHEHTVWFAFCHLVVGRAQVAKDKALLCKSFSTWSRNAVIMLKLRSRMSIFALRTVITAKSNLFAAWNDYRLDWQRRIGDLSPIMHRRCLISQKAHFHGWKAVTYSLRMQTNRLKRVCARISERDVSNSLARWNQLTYDNELLLRKHEHLAHGVRQRRMKTGFRGLHMNKMNWYRTNMMTERSWRKRVLTSTHEVLVCWRNRFCFERRAKKFLSYSFERSDERAQLRAFASWMGQRRSTRRLDRQIDVWDHRTGKEFFDAWLAVVSCSKDKRVRAWLMCLRSTHKAVNQVFLFWENLSSVLRNRRIKVIKMRERINCYHLRDSFERLLDGTALLRRRRQLLAKTKNAVERHKISIAAERLLVNSKRKLNQRRVILMLLKRHHSKIIKHAWGEWEMRFESKKRMQAAYMKAMQMED